MNLIFVAHNAGRCGSSLMMACLAHCGADVGKVSTVKSVENPTGFFELDKYMAFCKKHFGPHLAPFGKQWEPKRLYAGKQYFNLISVLFESFDKDNDAPMAMKVMGFCPIAMFDEEDDIRVIHMHRKVENQAKSIPRMWTGKPEGYERFIPWLKSWDEWLPSFKAEYPHVKFYDVDFEKLVSFPKDIMDGVCDFCGLPKADSYPMVNPSFSRSGI